MSPDYGPTLEPYRQLNRERWSEARTGGGVIRRRLVILRDMVAQVGVSYPTAMGLVREHLSPSTLMTATFMSMAAANRRDMSTGQARVERFWPITLAAMPRPQRPPWAQRPAWAYDLTDSEITESERRWLAGDR